MLDRGPQDAAVEFRGVTKNFGGLVANDGISFAIPRGTIHGIVGENGAGKSTLMNILFGIQRADAGDILIKGDARAVRDSADAIRRGVGMVHQHFMLVDRLSALQNIVIGAESGFFLGGGVGRGRAAVQAIQERYGLNFPLDEAPRNLAVGVQQQIEIVKALYRKADILILDEPTGVLTPQEADRLFEVVRDLRTEGKTVILITHKLREILAVTDNVTVLRQGKCVATLPTAATTRGALAEMMVGRKLKAVELPPSRPSAEPVLRVKDLHVAGRGGAGVNGLTLDVRGGEILGIAGVAGNGQSELLMAIAGLAPVAAGEIECAGAKRHAGTRPSPRAAQEGRLAHVPEDRHRMGMIGEWSSLENSVLGLQRSGGVKGLGFFLAWKQLEDWCRKLMAANDVRPADPHRPMGVFSGGNQQKLVIGRALAHDPDVLLVGQPTRGVDIGAVEAIHRKLVDERGRGKTLLLVSVELDEILALSDRVLVMFEGRSMGELARGELDETLLGLMMAGTPKEEALTHIEHKETA
jgi:ABC-type uncharacterized transport system ATPase subunit